MPKWEEKAEAGAERVVRSFANKPMHWSTVSLFVIHLEIQRLNLNQFRVINKNHGYWKRAYARKDGDELNPYDWNQDLSVSHNKLYNKHHNKLI